MRAAGRASVERLEAGLAEIHPALVPGWRALALGVEAYAISRTGRRFSALSPGRRLELLATLDRHELSRNVLRGVLAPLKLAHFDDPAQQERLGCRLALDPPVGDEPARWTQQVVDGASMVGDDVECDVVVVGSGAGGAPVAARLAERGLAVLLLEEGEHHTRRHFSGQPVEMLRKLYRNGGATVAVGNTVIPIPVGRAVGGTTLVNSGTCFRIPAHTLADWQTKSGSDAFAPGGLDPWYAQVERDLEVAPSSMQAIGAPGHLVARGCDALGWSHLPLLRNAPGCDGQGVCAFGCPTGAKRSTNVSYVPMALTAGATLSTGSRVRSIWLENGRAVGVVASTARGDLRVRARAVVLSCGALSTPALLLSQRIGNVSGQLGRNLSIHPSTASLGRFAEDVDGFRAVPQGWGIDEFHDEGLLFEGASLPLPLTAAMTPGFGPSWTSLFDDARRGLLFGFLVKDQSRGRVSVLKSGRTGIGYWLNRSDVRKVQRGLTLLARLHFAAGATEVVQPVHGHARLSSLADVERFEAANCAARHFDLSAYHPAGTCRIGVNPATSVTGADHQLHDVPGLYVVDASSFPGSSGVNPQLTIMAMALRAADGMAKALSA